MSINLEQFLQGYQTCALWSTSDSYDQEGDEQYNLDSEFSEFSEACSRAMRSDCKKFIAENGADLQQFRNDTACDDYRLGFLFWLDREGHGSGFWDYELGDKLSDACRPYGGFPLYGDFEANVVRSHHYG